MIKKIDKLEAIRGFIAVYVVVHHVFTSKIYLLGSTLSFLFHFGQEVVVVSFILSGFVIQLSTARHPSQPFKTYFYKRFSRVYIPLICVFIVHYLLWSFERGYFFPINIGRLIGNLLMLQDTYSLKPRVICIPFLGNTPLWSLSYEWWFYILFYFFTTQFSSKASRWVYVLSTISTISYIWYPFFLNRQFMYLIIPWIGVAIAQLYCEKKTIDIANLKVPLIFLLINTSVLGLKVLYLHSSISLGISPFLEFRHFSFALVAILLCLLWIKFQLIGFSRIFNLFIPMASISYGIYISHWFLIVKASYLNYVITNIYIRLGVYMMVCLLFAYFIEHIVYVRLNKWIRNLRIFNL